jgi:hypothetical protein
MNLSSTRSFDKAVSTQEEGVTHPLTEQSELLCERISRQRPARTKRRAEANTETKRTFPTHARITIGQGIQKTTWFGEFRKRQSAGLRFDETPARRFATWIHETMIHKQLWDFRCVLLLWESNPLVQALLRPLGEWRFRGLWFNSLF